MGMFDTIYCRQPLPDGLRTEDFQTMSLHNTLSTASDTLTPSVAGSAAS
jgi:hypothetical protein